MPAGKDLSPVGNKTKVLKKRNNELDIWRGV